MDGLIVVVALVAVGALLRSARALPPEAPQVLSRFVICVSLPALILQRVPRLAIPAGAAMLVVLPWALLALLALLVLAAARTFRWDRATTGALLLVVPLGNTSFLGLPMIRALLGEDAVPYALLYDQLGTFLGLATYGSVVLAAYGGAERPTLPGVLRRVAAFPPFVALILSLALRGTTLPAWGLAVLDAAAASLVPVIMVAVGLLLDVRVGRAGLAPLGVGLTLKLIVAPAAAWALCQSLDVPQEVLRVGVLEAAMPSMITAGALAAGTGLAPRLASSMVGIGILFSLATLPLLSHLL